MNNQDKIDYIRRKVCAYEDFPKKGIVFQDIFGALADPKACQYIRDLLVQHIKETHPEVELVVGLDARGFLFNCMIAVELGVGCAAIRKKGKLPGEVVSVEYELEYGSNTFELQKDAVRAGQKVIIVDDLLATGGSLEAAIKLVTKAGGVVLECLTVVELPFLKGRDKLSCDVHSLLTY